MYQARLQATPLREAEIDGADTRLRDLQQSYRSLLQKKEESQMSANLEKRQIGEQFKILDPARMPEKPISPDRPRLYLMALIASIAAGFGAGGLREFFDRTLRTEADVRAALNLMVLATVPLIRDTVGIGHSPLARQLAVGAGALTVLAVGAAVAWRLLR